MKPRVVIKDWFFCYVMGNLCLGGRLQDHPKFPADFAAYTSKILGFNRETMEVETQNTIYKLTRMNPAYRLWAEGQKFAKSPLGYFHSNVDERYRYDYEVEPVGESSDS